MARNSHACLPRKEACTDDIYIYERWQVACMVLSSMIQVLLYKVHRSNVGAPYCRSSVYKQLKMPINQLLYTDANCCILMIELMSLCTQTTVVSSIYLGEVFFLPIVVD